MDHHCYQWDSLHLQFMASGGGLGVLWIPPSPPMAVGVEAAVLGRVAIPPVGVRGVLLLDGDTDVVRRIEEILLPLSVRRCRCCCPAATYEKTQSTE